MVAPYSVERAWCSRQIRYRPEPANSRKIAAPPSGLGVHRREGYFGCNRCFSPSPLPRRSSFGSPVARKALIASEQEVRKLPPWHRLPSFLSTTSSQIRRWCSREGLCEGTLAFVAVPSAVSAFPDLGSHGESTRPPSFPKWTHRWSTLNGFPSLPVKFPTVCSRYDYARVSVFKAVSLFCLNPFVDFVVQTLGSSFVFPGHVCLCNVFI
ncbi:hypothetical protein GQ457_05G014900 [Hibiscus cannabinus]